MFCNRCGMAIQADLAVCPRCGRRIGDPVRALAQSRLERHLPILEVLWMVVGGLFFIPAVGLLAFGQGVHLLVHDRAPWAGLFQLLVLLAGCGFLILAAGGVCVGLGLRQRRPWARTVALILGVLALLHPPFGTALGVYSLWVLLADDGGEEYHYLAEAAQS